MQFLDKLERKFGKFAIPNLMLYIIFGQGIVFFATLINPILLNNFSFSWAHILQGQVWRLITFIFIPTSLEPMWFLLMVIIYYSVGSNLERILGTFNFNFYYFISIICTIIICAIFGIQGNIGTYINTSLWLSLATFMPEMSFYLYFIIPLKAKYLVYIYLLFMLWDVIGSSNKIATLLQIIASLAGYIIFFVIPLIRGNKFKIWQHSNNKQKSKSRTKSDKVDKVIKVAFHKCTVCGKTELDDEDLDFRYCSTCNKEYCIDHLKFHDH
ncbi:hypothetical protein AN641_02110 [Candidatus Epulonipiscioides gigas]|nr:hypothetical protein AN641_02110 [Epulopiscium sp. SCG-C07WGA-EpuloA2]